MVQIVRFSGTDEQLYRLVAPLVMDANVLRQNNNFPFRTGKNFMWFLACEGTHVLGFVPVEYRKSKCVINNYYIEGHDAMVLQTLVDDAITVVLGEGLALDAVVLKEDVPVFERLHFAIETNWTRYVRMKLNK